jgi:hypothetical protein
MKTSRLLMLGCWLLVGGMSRCALGATYFVTVAGLGGEPDYEQRFTAAAKDLDKAFRGIGASAHVTTLMGKDATRARLTEVMGAVAREAKGEDDFVLVLIGHGTFNGGAGSGRGEDGGDGYKFNLVGPDVTAAELAGMCDKIAARRQLVVNTTSASGGAVMALRRAGRAVVAATKSGTEKNATVFARYWVEAMQDPAADVDKSDSISAMEAFQYADKKTAAFYESQKRLATEHAVFEDTGRGEPVRTASGNEGNLLRSFTVLRIGASQKAANDPARQQLLLKKEDLEQKIAVLKYGKAAMDPEQYKKQLRETLVQLAEVQGELDK